MSPWAWKLLEIRFTKIRFIINVLFRYRIPSAARYTVPAMTIIKFWHILLVLTALAAFLLLRYFLIPWASPIPEALKAQGIPKQLRPCEGSPNCVSSSSQGSFYIEPLSYEGDMASAKARLVKTINELGSGNLVNDALNADGAVYLHAVFHTKLMRYLDDSEFLFDESQKLIYLRSASRLGRGDMGVNHQRMESIRQAFYGAQD